MIGELALRFVLGGVAVSLFTLAGEAFRPKTFAGVFGAAPSTALATLALAYSKQGAGYVGIEVKAMLVGCVALLIYGAVCVDMTKKQRIPVPLVACSAWIAWLVCAFGLWTVFDRMGVLS